MKQKTLIQLSLVLIVLALVFIFAQRSTDRTANDKAVTIFRDLDGEKVAKVRFQQGESSVDLELAGDRWVLPGKNGYPADSGKVRSFFLKTLDLTVSQLVTTNPENFAALGVADESVPKGSAKITFLGADGKEMGGLFFGETRKKRGAGAPIGMSHGRYLRRAGKNEVYLTGDSMPVSATADAWLDTELVSVPQTSILSVEQLRGDGSSEAREFLLERSDPKASISGANAKITPPLDEKDKPEDMVMAQIVSALENARMMDVLSAKEAAEKLKDVKFDQKTIFTAANGLVYTAQSAETADKAYLKLDVRFDQATATAVEEEVKKRNEAAKTAFEAGKVEHKEGKEPQPPVEEKAQISSAGEAEKLSARLSAWVYELPKYEIQKYRHKKADLVKAEPPPQSQPPPPPNFGGMPGEEPPAP